MEIGNKIFANFFNVYGMVSAFLLIITIISGVVVGFINIKSALVKANEERQKDTIETLEENNKAKQERSDDLTIQLQHDHQLYMKYMVTSIQKIKRLESELEKVKYKELSS